MKTTMIHIKTEQRVKDEAQRLAEELGFTLSSLLTASLKQFIRTRSVQFSADYRMTPYLEGALDDIEKDVVSGKNLSPRFSNMKEMDKYLLGK